MRAIGNILWFIFGGLISGGLWLILKLFACIYKLKRKFNRQKSSLMLQFTWQFA